MDFAQLAVVSLIIGLAGIIVFGAFKLSKV